MAQFEPIWPRSISGKNYRVTLSHPETEAIAHRADRSYRSMPLDDVERGMLINLYDELCKIDRFLVNRQCLTRSLSKGFPAKLSVRWVEFSFDAASAVAHGVLRYVEDLEAKYFAASDDLV